VNAAAALDAIASAIAALPPAPAPDPAPTPAPPPPTPITPTRPPAVAPVLQSLRVTGAVTSRRAARVAYALTADAPVTAVIRCTGARPCTHRVRLAAGARGFNLARRQGGRLLAVGRYTLTLSTPGGSTGSAGFVVRSR
jgi:hypothetical protein